MLRFLLHSNLIGHIAVLVMILAVAKIQNYKLQLFLDVQRLSGKKNEFFSMTCSNWLLIAIIFSGMISKLDFGE